MVTRQDVKKLIIQIQTNLDQGKKKEAVAGLRELTKMGSQIFNPATLKVQQEGLKNLTRQLTFLTKELRETRRETAKVEQASKSFSLQMINMRDAGSSFVIMGQRIKQIMDGLRDTFLDFAKASQQFRVLGDALDSAIGDKAIARATEFAIQFGQSATEIVEGMRDVAAMGVTAGEAEQFMEAALLAATAGMGNAKDVAVTLLNVIRAFGLETEDVIPVAAQLAFIANETGLNLEEMTVAMQFAGAQAGQMGFSLAETAAALGILRDAGLEASKTGTALRQFMVRLQAPTRESKDLLAELGIELENEEGGFKDIATIMFEVIESMEDLNLVRQQEITNILFETRGQQLLNITQARGVDELQRLIVGTEALNDSTAGLIFLQKTSADMLANVGDRWAMLKERQDAAARSLAKNIIPVQVKFFEAQVAILEVMTKLSPASQQLAGGALLVAQAFFTTFGHSLLLTTSIITSRANFKRLTVAMVTNKVATDASTGSMVRFAVATKLAAGILGVAGLFLAMEAISAKTPEMKAALSALTGVVLGLAAALFLQAKGWIAATGGFAAVGIIAGLATAAVAFSQAEADAANFGQNIPRAQLGTLVRPTRLGTPFIVGEGRQEEIISPVGLMEQTFRGVIREEPSPIDIRDVPIVEVHIHGPVFGLEEVAAVIDMVISEKLRDE